MKEGDTMRGVGVVPIPALGPRILVGILTSEESPDLLSTKSVDPPQSAEQRQDLA